MNEKKNAIDSLFEDFNDVFARVASLNRYDFERRAGPNIGRALRHAGRVEKGLFLELDVPWKIADENDPRIVLAYAARVIPSGSGFPVYVLSKVFYRGPLSGIKPEIENLLRSALSELISITEEEVLKGGVKYTKFPEADELNN